MKIIMMSLIAICAFSISAKELTIVKKGGVKCGNSICYDYVKSTSTAHFDKLICRDQE